MKGVLLAMLAAGMLFSVADAQIQVQTSQDVYSYGDRLEITVGVSEVTLPIATFTITDEDGKKSSDVKMDITQKQNTMTASAFLPELFGPGTYTIQVQYDGQEASTTFEIDDSGIAIPFEINVAAKLWLEDNINDTNFIKSLAKNNVIDIPQTVSNATIPSWMKTTIMLWIQGTISDDTLINALKYLLSTGIITIE